MITDKYSIVHTESSGGWGGQEIRILSEAKEALKHGHQVTLLCDADTPIAKRAKKYDIPTVELPIGKKSLKGLFALRRWFLKNDFDVINTHSSSDSWMVALGMRLALHVKPLVRTRHVSAPVSNNKATRWLYQVASDHIVTTGEKLREALVNNNNISPERITSVPTGIDVDLFQPPLDKESTRLSLGLPTGKSIIGIVATLRSWKGHSYLIDAFKSLDNDNLHLLIVGDGPQWDSLNAQVQSLDLAGQVTLCGDQENVVPWLQSMDLFVLPSYANEGVPQSLMQAMACGVPVISTDVGSICEIVRDGSSGSIVKARDASDLSRAMNNLLDQCSLRDEFSSNALAQAKDLFGLNVMFKKMHGIFSGVINEDK